MVMSLRAHRYRVGWSQVELARRANVTQKTISLLERGHRLHSYPATCKRIADALGVEVAEIEELAACVEQPPISRT
jgi:transcriptional regulator with XRE-family HTH domain